MLSTGPAQSDCTRLDVQDMTNDTDWVLTYDGHLVGRLQARDSKPEGLVCKRDGEPVPCGQRAARSEGLL